MATSVSPVPRQVFLKNDGSPNSGGFLYSYASGTSTPLATYNDPDLLIGHVNPNPITLNSAGRPDISGTEINVYLQAALYDFVLKDSSGTTIWTSEKVYADFPAIFPSSFAIGDLLYADSTSSLARLADVSAGKYLRAGGVATAPLWSTLVLPNTATADRIPYATSTNTWGDASGFTFNGTNFAIPGLADFSAAAAGQIKFPATQNPSSDANTLDDYEEGSWTPVLGGSGGTSGQSYATQVGRYVKIGRQMIAQFRVTLTAKGTITTQAQIQGLPYAAENTASLFGTIAIGYFQNLGANKVFVTGYMTAGATAATLVGLAAAAASTTELTTSDIADTTDIVGTITYRASA